MRHRSLFFVLAAFTLLLIARATPSALAVDFTTWSSEPVFPIIGYQYDPVEYNGYIYVVGGYNGVSFDTVYYARVNSFGHLGDWKQTTSLPEVDQAPGVTVSNCQIYTALYNGNVYRAPINPDGTLGSWQQETKAADNHGGRLQVEAYRGYLYILGGWVDFTFYGSPPKIVAG